MNHVIKYKENFTYPNINLYFSLLGGFLSGGLLSQTQNSFIIFTCPNPVLLVPGFGKVGKHEGCQHIYLLLASHVTPSTRHYINKNFTVNVNYKDEKASTANIDKNVNKVVYFFFNCFYFKTVVFLDVGLHVFPAT